MQKLTIIIALLFVLGLTTTSYSQNVWDGSSVKTTTNGSALIKTNLTVNNTLKVDGGIGLGSSSLATRLMYLYDTNTSKQEMLRIYGNKTSTGNNWGIFNQNFIYGDGIKKGFYNYTKTNLTGKKYGFENYLHTGGTEEQYGIYNRVYTSNSSATAYGLYSQVWGSTGLKYGVYSLVSSSNEAYGVYSRMTGNGGPKYGVYSHVDGPTNFAGLFKGKVRVEGSDLELYNTVSGSKVLLHNSETVNNGQNFSIVFEDGGGNWDWDNILRVNKEGLLDKRVNHDGDAFIVSKLGETNFSVKGDGHVYAREIEVTLDPFPDYVFDDRYNLLPLSELSEYIEENQHLPNIPSAEEVKENGIGLGELSLKQMEKIEELTLYLIEINERLNAVEKENIDLKKEIKRLQN